MHLNVLVPSHPHITTSMTEFVNEMISRHHHALIAMRQQDDQAVLTDPLVLSTAKELIYDALQQ